MLRVTEVGQNILLRLAKFLRGKKSSSRVLLKIISRYAEFSRNDQYSGGALLESTSELRKFSRGDKYSSRALQGDIFNMQTFPGDDEYSGRALLSLAEFSLKTMKLSTGWASYQDGADLIGAWWHFATCARRCLL